MTQVKKKPNAFWEYVKYYAIKEFMLLLTYLAASSIIMLVVIQDAELKYNTMMISWGIAFALALAYNYFYGWLQGGTEYDMLVSGNMKRMSLMEGQVLKISSHKVYKEYRPWKGFIFGIAPALFSLASGIIFGVNSDKVAAAFEGVSTGSLGWMFMMVFMFSSWSIMPFFAKHLHVAAPNYFLSCLFALLPIVISGVSYIIGAYSKRAKAIKAQELADREREREEKRERKVNYGGLPGTTPKKRK